MSLKTDDEWRGFGMAIAIADYFTGNSTQHASTYKSKRRHDPYEQGYNWMYRK
jgi:hypothetical protein